MLNFIQRVMGLKREGTQLSLVTVERAVLWLGPEFHKLYFLLLGNTAMEQGYLIFFACISIVTLPDYEKK